MSKFLLPDTPIYEDMKYHLSVLDNYGLDEKNLVGIILHHRLNFGADDGLRVFMEDLNGIVDEVVDDIESHTGQEINKEVSGVYASAAFLYEEICLGLKHQIDVVECNLVRARDMATAYVDIYPYKSAQGPLVASIKLA